MFRKTILAFVGSVVLLCGQATSGSATTLIFPPPVQAFEELKAYLGLSEGQVSQLRDLLAERDAAVQATYKQLAAKQAEIETLLKSGSRDVTRIGQLMLDIHSLQNQSSPTDEWRVRAVAVLTPEQRTKLVSLDQAMKLANAGHQAVMLQLIDPPSPGRPIPLASPVISTSGAEPAAGVQLQGPVLR